MIRIRIQSVAAWGLRWCENSASCGPSAYKLVPMRRGKASGLATFCWLVVHDAANTKAISRLRSG